jgi:hypothetical protein
MINVNEKKNNILITGITMKNITYMKLLMQKIK